MKGAIEATFHGQKTFRLGSLSWSETPHFHNRGPSRIVPMLPRSIRKKIFYSKQLYLGNKVTETNKLGLILKSSAKTLMSANFQASNSLKKFWKRGKREI